MICRGLNMIVAHNLMAMNTNRQYGIVNAKKAKNTEKLASGYRINRSADDAAGLAISEKMRRQIRGLNQGAANIQDGVSWVQIGDGAMEEVNEILNRMVELSVQASNGTLTDEDRSYINEEINHLKMEINRIGNTTEFNNQKIFIMPEASLDISGKLTDLNVFNSSYDSTTGNVEYGGFIFKGERITWDKVDPDMVYQEPTTGEMLFKGGTYTYTNSANCKFEIECEKDAKIPTITRKIDISASSAGISIDGDVRSWDDFIDEDGVPASSGNLHQGTWTLEHEGATISYYFFQDISTMDEMIEGINNGTDGEYKYTWEQPYVGPVGEKAVDITTSKDLNITQDMVDNLVDGQVSYTVRAGNNASNNEDGIWLEDYKGNKIAGSYQSWKDLGITSWDSGSDISAKLTYKYEDTDGTADTLVSFIYKLSDVTSVDSVIDGLDGMKVQGVDFRTNYDVESTVNAGSNVTKNNLTFIGEIDFAEEVALGRNFDSQTQNNVANADIEYDAAAGTSKVTFKDASSNEVLSFTGDVSTQAGELLDEIGAYAELAENKKQAAILAGENPDTVKIETPNLTDIVGNGNITTSGYFDGTVTIDSSMKLTDADSGYNPGEVGKTYPTAYIDFSDMGSTYSMDDLLGAGFNTTCKTCNNHYSIQFVDSLTDSKTTTAGYEYKKTTQGYNYTLLVDINSLKDAGVDTGQEFAAALVDVTSEAYDFHYTQYAAEGGKLYTFDNRIQNTGTTAATFDTYPYDAINVGQITVNMTADDGDIIKLEYGYDFADLKDCIKVDMIQDNAGDYVQVTDGSGKVSYEKYDSTKHATTPASDRFHLQTSYELDGTSYTTLDELKTVYADRAMKEMLNNTNIQLNAKDYSKFSFSGNEKSNVAINSEFDSEIVKEEYRGIIIQCSAKVDDQIEIPQFELNTMDLRIHNASTKTIEDARETLGMTKKALHRLNKKRTVYGAYQNRLEASYNNNMNVAENTTAAEQRIRDTDMAKEMVDYSKNNILTQVGQSMMAQANQSNQGVLSLLQ